MNESQWLLILKVAVLLPKTFTKADLCVAAWNRHPGIFGMKDYNLPDTQRVLCKIDGHLGLIGRGYLEQLKDGLVSVTNTGRKAVKNV